MTVQLPWSRYYCKALALVFAVPSKKRQYCCSANEGLGKEITPQTIISQVHQRAGTDLINKLLKLSDSQKGNLFPKSHFQFYEICWTKNHSLHTSNTLEKDLLRASRLK